jgi:hypothetical protein
MNALEIMIEKGELAREENKYHLAQAYFDQVIISAGLQKKWKYVVSVIAHRLIIYKHLYSRTEDLNFLEIMFSEIAAGLKISKRERLPKEEQAPLILRWGDYYLLQKKYTQSVRYYSQALKAIGKSNPSKYAEYLGHYGYALSMSGVRKGLEYVESGIRLAEKDDSLRPFHKQTVLCGLYMRYAEAADSLKDKKLVQVTLEKARECALILSKEYKQPKRLAQVKELEKKLKH